MGLETLLEAAKFLEYKAEVEARGEKGFPALPSNSSSAVLLSPSQNGYTNNHVVVQNGIHYNSHSALSYPKNLSNNTGHIPRVPEPLNFNKTDHSYRRVHLSQSPTYEFQAGANRGSKGNTASSSSSNSSVNSRNSGTREVHNKLEKNRRAHLKECFEMLKGQLPSFEDRKISNLAILRSSLRYITTLKRKERDFEHEMERLAREKISVQQRLSTLKKDMLGKWDHLDWRAVLPEDLSGVEMESDTSIPVDYGNGRKTVRKSVTSSSTDAQSLGNDDSDNDESDDAHYPISLSMKKERHDVKEYGQVNGINGMNGTGPISLVTATKLSPSPLAAITVEKTANSPVGGASFVNCVTSPPPTKGFSILHGISMGISSRMDMGQYYEEEKMCK